MEEKVKDIKRYPKRILASFQLGNLVGLMMSQMYSQQFSTYYLVTVGLDQTLFFVAMTIFTVFNMFNDPFIAYLTERSTRFTSKWGKRFPFILLGAFPYALMVIILYSAPSVLQVGQIAAFFWLLIFYCIQDSVFSLYDINRVALFPDKFRDVEDRRTAGAITALLETIGVLLGILIPTLLVDEAGNGWDTTAIVVAIISVIMFILMIPGVRESQELRERRIKLDKTIERDSFFGGIMLTLKDKNFLSYIIFYTAYTSAMGVVMLSIPFFIRDYLLLDKEWENVLIVYVLFVIIAAPLWYKLSKKIGIKKVAAIGGSILGCAGIPLMLIPNSPDGVWLLIAIFIAAGFVDGAIISMTMPIFSSVIDNAAVKSGKRQEGIYQGTFVFFSRLGIFIRYFAQYMIFLIFRYESPTSDPTQLLGLKIQIAVVPTIISLVGVVLFWKLYSLTTEQIEANTKKIIELQI